MSESHNLSDDSDRYAAEVFDAQRAEILAFFLVGVCEDPADRVRIGANSRKTYAQDKLMYIARTPLGSVFIVNVLS